MELEVEEGIPIPSTSFWCFDRLEKVGQSIFFPEKTEKQARFAATNFKKSNMTLANHWQFVFLAAEKMIDSKPVKGVRVWRNKDRQPKKQDGQVEGSGDQSEELQRRKKLTPAEVKNALQGLT